MRHMIIGLLLLSHGGIAAQDRPNVILILTDDQGYGDLGSQGNPFIQTPHLDRLYAESGRRQISRSLLRRGPADG